ncbi:CHAT domain-containing protein [Cyathus striatus]|nr:CHAT domain-containing protein [Cyathus striatus]
MDYLYSTPIEELLNSGLPSDVLLPKLGELGLHMQEKYETEGDLADLENSIIAFEKLLFVLPAEDVNTLAAMGNLAISLAKRYDRVGKIEDLEEAIMIQRDLVSLSKHKDSTKEISSMLSNLGCSIRTRFEQLGNREDLDEAIYLLEESMLLMSSEEIPTGHSMNNLAGALLSRFQKFGKPEDLEKSILLFEDALSMAPPGSTKSVALSNLALALKERIQYTGEENDFEHLISLIEEALSLVPPRHESRSELLNNLGITLKFRFRQFGNMEDLDKSVAALEEALYLDPAEHTFRGLSLNNLALSLQERFVQLEHMEDLNTIIALHKEALSLRPPGNSYRSSSLSNLAVSLSLRYEKQGRSGDLNQALIYEEEALSLCPPGQEGRIGSLNNLSHLLKEKFHETVNKEYHYLDEAILLQEEAHSYKSTSYHDSYAVLSNLGNLYDIRFQHLKNKNDLDKAVSFAAEAAECLTQRDWNKNGSLCNLAYALQRRFENFGQTDDLNTAINIFMEITSAEGNAATRLAFNASQQWAKLAHESSHYTALQAYRTSIALLSPLASLTYDVHSRQQALSVVGRGFASDAAYCAMQQEHLDISIEMLETGRSVFWSQALQTRSEVQKLAENFPHLERRLRDISQTLETASYRTIDMGTYNFDIDTVLSRSREASNLVKLNEERLKLLNEIRGISGFERFLQPLQFDDLKAAARKGYIVILNATRFGSCDALILTPNSNQVTRLKLLNVTTMFLDFVAILMRLAKKCGDNGVDVVQISTTDSSTVIKLGDTDKRGASRSIRFGQKATDYSNFDSQVNFPSTVTAVLEWLWVTIVSPVLQILDIKTGDGNDLPRLWWYPTGRFTELPLHAAGIYSGEFQECISDYVISSYTSTLTALHSDNTSPCNEKTSEFKLVAVADTTSLHATAEELEHIKRHVPESHIIEIGAPGSPPASIKEVSSHMATASIVHFACHGRQIPDNPLHSYLQLSHCGQNLEISTIMQLSIPSSSIAFLSACETAMGDQNLPDESLHIGASLIFAGFQSVVATMWEIDDFDGPAVAGAFYEYLFNEVDFSFSDDVHKQFDPTKSAEALHYAVKVLRSHNVPVHRWAPFIHIGK